MAIQMKRAREGGFPSAPPAPVPPDARGMLILVVLLPSFGGVARLRRR